MNPATAIPPKVRLRLYLAWTLAGPVAIYLAAKDLISAPEVALYAGIGTALGWTAASHTPASERPPVEPLPVAIVEPAQATRPIPGTTLPEVVYSSDTKPDAAFHEPYGAKHDKP